MIVIQRAYICRTVSSTQNIPPPISSRGHDGASHPNAGRNLRRAPSFPENVRGQQRNTAKLKENNRIRSLVAYWRTKNVPETHQLLLTTDSLGDERVDSHGDRFITWSPFKPLSETAGQHSRERNHTTRYLSKAPEKTRHTTSKSTRTPQACQTLATALVFNYPMPAPQGKSSTQSFSIAPSGFDGTSKPKHQRQARLWSGEIGNLRPPPRCRRSPPRQCRHTCQTPRMYTTGGRGNTA